MEKNIVLLHGWGAEVKKLFPLKEELEKLGWNVFLPKLAGFDDSPPKEVWGVKEYGDFIGEEAGKCFKRNNYFVFGHSFGGRIAIKMAYRKFTGLSGIILCATGGISRGKLIKRLIFATLAKTGYVFLLVPDFAVQFKKLLYKASHEHDYEKTEGVMRDVFKKVVSEDLKPYLHSIKLPTLILWGKLDKVAPIADAYIVNKNIVNSKLTLFNDEGHRLPYNKAEEIALEIEKWYKQLK